MTKRADRHSLRLWLVSAGSAIVLAAGLLAGLSTQCLADEPKPDPSGTATGDKTTAVDAAGNPFVVAEPTDKTAPDYAANKKAFDDYQAQARRSRSRSNWLTAWVTFASRQTLPGP
jgi:hypothetical protein